MACYRCGTRQVDPVRGHSPWQRGVRGDQQVLICPTCQGIHDWKADLDQCGRCGSVRLVRRLGEAECRDCGFVVAPGMVAPSGEAVAPGMVMASEVAVAARAVGAPGEVTTAVAGAGRDAEMPGLPGAEAPGLSEEVERALERVLGRGPIRR